MSKIKIPEQIVQELKMRQQWITQINNEINLILKTFMATISNDKTYKLSDDLTELIEIKISKDKNQQE